MSDRGSDRFLFGGWASSNFKFLLGDIALCEVSPGVAGGGGGVVREGVLCKLATAA